MWHAAQPSRGIKMRSDVEQTRTKQTPYMKPQTKKKTKNCNRGTALKRSVRKKKKKKKKKTDPPWNDQ